MYVRLPAVSESCFRTIQRFVAFEDEHEHEQSSLLPAHLVLAILQEESLGSECLRALNVDLLRIAGGCFGSEIAAISEREPAVNLEQQIAPDSCSNQRIDVCLQDDSAVWFRPVLEKASAISRRLRGGSDVTTVHIVQAICELPGPARDVLNGVGVSLDRVTEYLQLETESPAPLKVDFELEEPAAPERPPRANPDNNDSRPSNLGVATAIDANLNRAREGLRVVDDYARFVSRDAGAMALAKTMRHDLVAAERSLRTRHPQLNASRDVQADPGTTVTLSGETDRSRPEDVAISNVRRVQEALRSLEEFGKLLSTEFAECVKQLRYQSYELEQRLSSLGQQRRTRLLGAQLYVLITERLCRFDWKETVQAALAGGADVLQLREKELPDAEYLRRATWLAQTCHDHDALMIVNDRTALVHDCGADGVHLGQTDGDVNSAREQIGSCLLYTSPSPRDS